MLPQHDFRLPGEVGIFQDRKELFFLPLVVNLDLLELSRLSLEFADIFPSATDGRRLFIFRRICPTALFSSR